MDVLAAVAVVVVATQVAEAMVRVALVVVQARLLVDKFALRLPFMKGVPAYQTSPSFLSLINCLNMLGHV